MPGSHHDYFWNGIGISSCVAVLVLTIISGGIGGCGQGSRSRAPAGEQMAGMTIEDVLKQNADFLMSVPGVVGAAVSKCEGKPCILVLVVKKTPAVMDKIPSRLEGFPVVVEATGTLRPLDRG